MQVPRPPRATRQAHVDPILDQRARPRRLLQYFDLGLVGRLQSPLDLVGPATIGRSLPGRERADGLQGLGHLALAAQIGGPPGRQCLLAADPLQRLLRLAFQFVELFQHRPSRVTFPHRSQEKNAPDPSGTRAHHSRGTTLFDRLAPALSSHRRQPEGPRSAAPVTVGFRSGLPTRMLPGPSPVSSGANFSGFFPGWASSRRPCLPGGCSPPTPLRHSLCVLDCGLLYPAFDFCQVAFRDERETGAKQARWVKPLRKRMPVQRPDWRYHSPNHMKSETLT